MRTPTPMPLVVCLIVILFVGLSATPQSVAARIAQDDTCKALVTSSLTQVAKSCASVGRNRVCYGSQSINALPQPGVTTFNFDQPVQIVSAETVQSLQLSALDVEQQKWGVALLQLQANLPDTTSNQGVTVLMFGDVKLENAVPIPATTVDLIVANNIPLRAAPSRGGAIIAIMKINDRMKATGRLANESWLLVQQYDGSKLGWIPGNMVKITGTAALSDLAVLDPKTPIYAPMQAFSLETGTETSTCTFAPRNGALIQSPRTPTRTLLVIDGVQIGLSSTIFVHAQASGNLVVDTLAGITTIAVNGKMQTGYTGTQVDVPLDDTLKPSGSPGSPKAVDGGDLPFLPLGNLPIPVSVAQR